MADVTPEFQTRYVVGLGLGEGGTRYHVVRLIERGGERIANQFIANDLTTEQLEHLHMQISRALGYRVCGWTEPDILRKGGVMTKLSDLETFLNEALKELELETFLTEVPGGVLAYIQHGDDSEGAPNVIWSLYTDTVGAQESLLAFVGELRDQALEEHEDLYADMRTHFRLRQMDFITPTGPTTSTEVSLALQLQLDWQKDFVS